MPLKTISTEIFINHLRDTIRNPDNKICFILGAGASVESGIDSGAKLAREWYSELSQFHSPEQIDKWKKEISFDEKNIPGFYSQLFNFRYEGHPEDGIDYITSIIEKGVPGFGYTIMSQLLQRTHHNVIITTNFDTLIEESLYIYADKRALVCNHENVAHLARPSSQRPLIVKIHRGLYMDPLNQQADIAVIKPQWKKALTDIFHNYIPIVIGYGGNDGSLMNYLKEIDPCQRMYWCVFGDTNPCDDIAGVVKRHNGCFVTTGGFNRLMFRFIDLFGLKKMHEVMEQTARERAEKLRLEFEEAGTEIGQTGTLEEKQELGRVAEDFDTSDWFQWQLKAGSTEDPKEKEIIYLQAIKALPENHRLHFILGNWLGEWGRYDEAITFYRKAIELKSDFYRAWYNMGIFYDNKGEFDEAIAAFRKVVEIKPDYHKAWHNMGISYQGKGDIANARRCNKKAYELNPDDEDYKKAIEKIGEEQLFNFSEKITFTTN
jgi:protein O-mannosyl-transferase